MGSNVGPFNLFDEANYAKSESVSVTPFVEIEGKWCGKCGALFLEDKGLQTTIQGRHDCLHEARLMQLGESITVTWRYSQG